MTAVELIEKDRCAAHPGTLLALLSAPFMVRCVVIFASLPEINHFYCFVYVYVEVVASALHRQLLHLCELNHGLDLQLVLDLVVRSCHPSGVAMLSVSS